MSRNRWFLLIGVALILGGGLGLARERALVHTPAPVAAEPTRAPAGVLPVRGAFSAPPPAGKIAVGSRAVSVRYTFDGGVHRAITDTEGRHELRPLVENGGELRLVPEGPGLALSYPARCRLARERECPRAILEGVRDDSLNPGKRPLSYGARVRMTPADLADGANVLQKGFSTGGVSQFKLQVDHKLGHPSCVLAGAQKKIYRAEAQVDISDGSWHRLACTRTADRLTLEIDGSERAAVAVPPTLTIANAEPLRIGGKSANKGNDQFAGEIDDVFLKIGG